MTKKIVSKSAIPPKKTKTSSYASNNNAGKHSTGFGIFDDFFKQIVNSLQDYCVITADKDGKITSWNAGAENILGYVEKEIIGKNAAIIFTPEDIRKNAPQKEMTTALAQGRALDERWHVKKNKERFWGSGLLFPLRDEQTKLLGYVKVMRDLTQKKIEELKEQERKDLIHELEIEKTKLVDIFENAPAFLGMIHGKNYVFTMANKAYYQLVGHRDIIGKPLIKALPELKGQQFIEILDNVYKTGKPFIGKEMKIMLQPEPKGPLIEKYVDFIYLASKDKNGLIEGIIAHGHDVTEQVLARKKVEETSERFRALADNIPNLVWMANSDGWIFWYNDQWYEYTGTTPEEMEGWGWKSVHDPATLPVVLTQWQASITNGKPFEMVFPIKGADGIFHPFLTRVVPVRDEEGKIIRWLGTNTDISNQKELERQKDNFLGMASHELKTPVTVIKAFAQVLQSNFEKEGNTVAESYLSKMNVQIDKLTSLIESLLDVTKMQTGKMHFTYSKFDFNLLVKETVDHVQLTTVQHKIEVKFDKTKMVYGDRERIGQVITNFIINAIKYSPHSDKIIVNTKAYKTTITLSVKDFGLGISKDNQNQVFEQFYRVSSNHQNTYPGVGLGLYISAEIIKREGGKIWVESEQGKGSTFYFSIPIKGSKER